jgi:hypothetical protein
MSGNIEHPTSNAEHRSRRGVLWLISYRLLFPFPVCPNPSNNEAKLNCLKRQKISPWTHNDSPIGLVSKLSDDNVEIVQPQRNDQGKAKHREHHDKISQNPDIH